MLFGHFRSICSNNWNFSTSRTSKTKVSKSVCVLYSTCILNFGISWQFFNYFWLLALENNVQLFHAKIGCLSAKLEGCKIFYVNFCVSLLFFNGFSSHCPMYQTKSSLRSLGFYSVYKVVLFISKEIIKLILFSLYSSEKKNEIYPHKRSHFTSLLMCIENNCAHY